MAPEFPVLGSQLTDDQLIIPELKSLRRPNQRPAPIGWGPDSSSTILRTDSFLDTPKSASSLVSPSSVINDYGDTKHLEENENPLRLRPRKGHQVSADDLVYLGAGFSSDSDLPTSGEPKTYIQNKITPPPEVSGDKFEHCSTNEVSLEESIRAAFIVSAPRDKKEILPLDALDKILTRACVRRELEKCTTISSGELDFFTDKIWGLSFPSSTTKTTRRKIFAILVLIGKVKEIVQFVQESLHDNDLPFILSSGLRPGLRQLYRTGKDGKLETIQLFSLWLQHELEFFNNAQWQIQVPYFPLITNEVPKVSHLPLANKTILPFIEDNEVTRAIGGFDDAMHNENPPFAVKRLRTNDYAAFNAEVSSLKRYSARDHLHLIKLLATFSWQDQYYLLFPWADGNLLNFWELHPNPSEPKRDYRLAFWFSAQCLGLFEGLKMIHTADKPEFGDPTHDSTHQLHGRHGDLKPENILWFKTYSKDLEEEDQKCRMGLLKLSDFGLTQFHRTASRSRISADRIPVSPTYRAPEYDVENKVSPSFDIWSLGCVLLEFITWYLLGWKEILNFSQRRVNEDSSEIKEDVFFKFVIVRNENGQVHTSAKLKQSVVDEITTLFKHKNCCYFFIDLLEFVQTRMLRLGPKNRAECQEIVKIFTELHQRCIQDRNYCTGRVKKPPHRTGTNLSLLQASPLELSQKMDKLINKIPLPEYTGPLENDYQDPESETSRVRMNTPVQVQTPTTASVKKHINTEVARPESMAPNDGESLSQSSQSLNRKVHFDEKLQSSNQGPDKSSSELSKKEKEEGEGKQIYPTYSGSALPNSSNPDSLSVPSPEEWSEEASQIGLDSINDPPKAFELSRTKFLQEKVISQHMPPTELTSTASEIAKSTLHKSLNPGSANVVLDNQMKETKMAKSEKHFSCGLFCFGNDY